MDSDVGFEELRAFAAVDEETRRRRASSVPVLDYRPEDERRARLAAPGSITVYVGRRGDERLDRLRSIAAGGADDGTLAEQLQEQHAGRRPRTPAEITEILRGSGSYATIRCGPRHLAAHVCLPEPGDLAVIPCAHNGGRLPAEELTLVEHVLDDSDEELEAVALRADPVLTPAEELAIERVGVDQVELNIAPNEGCSESMTAYAILILIALAILPVTDPVEHLDERTLEEIGPERSARQLMSIRQRAIRLRR